MKAFVDGDALCVTKDDFVNLVESPAVFIPLGSEVAKTIQEKGFRYLALEDLMSLANKLKTDFTRRENAMSRKVIGKDARISWPSI